MYQSYASGGREPVSTAIQNTINTYPLLSPKQERRNLEIVSMYKNGKRREQARKILLNSNLRLVVSRAAHYAKSGMSINDLISEGILGMLEAIDNFDLKYKNRLSTIATYWINLRMLQALRSLRAVHVPAHIAEHAAKRKKMEETDVVLSEKEIMQKLKISKEAMERVNMARFCVFSLDDNRYTNKYGDGMLWEEVIADDKTISPRAGTIRDEVRSILHHALEGLSPKEKEVIGCRFYNNENLSVVGKKLSRTSERIRQIEVKALKKLRKSLEKKNFEGSHELNI
jgi:RNA polymerase sigma factor (sigma-70 family)